MSLRQLYYTSCRNAASSRTGFQVKAASEGITQSVMDALNKIMGYTIPPRLRDQPISTHPVALRYQYLDAGAAMLVCSQSNGEDEFGRPGNYFAHAVTAEPALLTDPLPPITYWKSPFWQSRDASDASELPVSDSFDAEITFDYDAVWSFINTPPRPDWFRDLLSNVLHYSEAHRKIVILDTPDNIAQWIYAVSLALPSRYRPMLTFATYHQDPIYAPFMIAGTTADSGFRFAREDYLNYFVMNAEANQVSQAVPSVFASYMVERFNEDNYNDEILDFFEWLEAGRITPEPVLSPVLDELLNFFLANKGSLPATDARVISGIRGLVSEIAATRSSSPGDIDDLKVAASMLVQFLVNDKPDPERIADLGQVLAVLKPLYPDIAQDCQRVCQALLEFVMLNQPAAVAGLKNILSDIYAPGAVRKSINEMLPNFATRLRSTDIDQLNGFWKQVGGYLDYEQPKNLVSVFFTTFAAFPAESNTLKVPPVAQSLITLLIQTMPENTNLLLRMAYEYRKRHPESPVLEWIYYTLAGSSSLRERQADYWPYWEQFQDSTLSLYELQRDLDRQTSTPAAVKVIGEWVDIFRDTAESQQWVMDEGLQFLWQRTTDKAGLALHIVTEPRLEPLLSTEMYANFAGILLKNARFHNPERKTAELYRQFATRSDLNLAPAQQFIIQGALALYDKKLPSPDEEEYERWKQRFSLAAPEDYDAEVGAMMDAVFSERVRDKHIDLIALAYDARHRDRFWMLYWKKFQETLLGEDTGGDGSERRIAAIIDILDLWFKKSTGLMESYPYVVPEFFTRLLEVFEEIKAGKSYGRISRRFEAKIAEKDWFYVIEDSLKKRRGLLGGLFGS